MEKYVNASGKECYRDVLPTDKFSELEFHPVTDNCGDDAQLSLHTNLGSITILDRLTGYGYGIRDVETGYRDEDGRFWLVAGNFDIRRFAPTSIQDAIDCIKLHANVCRGV